MMRRITAGMAFPLFLISGGMVNAVEPNIGGADVTIESAWVRAMPPTQRSTAAYLSVKNNGDAPIVISGARSDSAKETQIHTSSDVDGYMRMERIESIELGARETLEFAPGGLHLMLLGLEQMPARGSTVNLCLLLASGSAICADAPVRKSAGESSHHHH